MAPVEFLEFDTGSKHGCARMSSAVGALRVCDTVGRLSRAVEPAPEGNQLLYVEGCTLLGGEEERVYWAKMQAAKLAKASEAAGGGHHKGHAVQHVAAKAGGDNGAGAAHEVVKPRGTLKRLDGDDEDGGEEEGEGGKSGEDKKRGREEGGAEAAKRPRKQ